MIKKIHYCWFGRNPKSEIIEKCISSWKRICPDYEIIEWNEDNFNINSCKYVQEAYNVKKWAFVSDYARFWILYNYGGIYVDTDVELIKSIGDLPETFVGFESKSVVNSGLIRGARCGDKVCKMMLDSYELDVFVNDDGSLNKKTVCERETQILEVLGLKLNGQYQKVDDTIVYPSEYFSPKDYITNKITITNNTYSIHHYEASWYSEEDKLAIELRNKYIKYMPKRLALRYSKFVAIKRTRGLKTALSETLRFLKRM